MRCLWSVKVGWIVLISVLVALLAAAACGGDDAPKAGALDAADVDAAVAKALAEQEAKAAASETRPIVISQNGWDSQELQIELARKILKDELGYDSELLFLNTEGEYQGICDGDIDIGLEQWNFRNQERADELVAEGCLEVWHSGAYGKSRWFVPTYVIEGDESRGIDAVAPDLRTPADLAKYAEVFATPETTPKGRLLDPVATWSTYGAERIEGMGLPFEVVYSGSEAASLAELDRSYAKGDPILIYFWQPHYIYDKYDLTEIEMPPYSEECFAKDFNCNNLDGELQTGVSGIFAEEFPDAYQFLKNMNDITNDDLAEMMFTFVEGASYEESVNAWMDHHQDKWRAWLP